MNEIKKIADYLFEIENYLIKNHVKVYVKIIENIRFGLEEGINKNDISKIKSNIDSLRGIVFSGMGSLGDLVITKKDDGIVEDEKIVNDKYYSLFTVLRHDLLKINI
jgi:hypothetical protein